MLELRCGGLDTRRPFAFLGPPATPAQITHPLRARERRAQAVHARRLTAQELRVAETTLLARGSTGCSELGDIGARRAARGDGIALAARRPVLALLLALSTGALAGLASLPHCVAMCGPYAAFACTSARARNEPSALPAFLIGRSLAYTTLGAVVGASGGVVAAWLPPRGASVLLAATLALGMLSLAWRLVRSPGARATAAPALVSLRTPVRAQAAPSEPSRIGTAWARASRHLKTAPLYGALMGLFPCGALYAALLVAASTASAWRGAATLLGFALTSGLALGLSGWIARLATSLDRPTRRALGAALVVGAVLLVARPLTAPDPASGTPACHHDEATP